MLSDACSQKVARSRRDGIAAATHHFNAHHHGTCALQHWPFSPSTLARGSWSRDAIVIFFVLHNVDLLRLQSWVACLRIGAQRRSGAGRLMLFDTSPVLAVMVGTERERKKIRPQSHACQSLRQTMSSHIQLNFKNANEEEGKLHRESPRFRGFRRKTFIEESGAGARGRCLVFGRGVLVPNAPSSWPLGGVREMGWEHLA